MSNSQRIIRRYSMAFKQKVVSEIESGKLNVSQAQKLYDITGVFQACRRVKDKIRKDKKIEKKISKIEKKIKV